MPSRRNYGLRNQGRILNPTPRTYRLPLAKDVPPMDVIFVEQPDPHGPFGAKAIKEVGVNCMAPAISNAVAHATGVRLRQLPMTPERVWRSPPSSKLSSQMLTKSILEATPHRQL